MERQSGVLLPIFSLKNEYGIGSFGKEAYEFVDFLSSAGQSFWQILPLVETGLGNSPYMSVAGYSYNPYFIDLQKLYNDGLITLRELNAQKVPFSDYIDYSNLYEQRIAVLQKAYERFDTQSKDFLSFKQSGGFTDYALFKALSSKYGTDFTVWPHDYKTHQADKLNQFYTENKELVDFYLFIQFTAQSQWFSLKNYANQNGIKIIGDLPFYPSFESVDVWSAPDNFVLDENLTPKEVAGVPPDYFAKDGQLWGNPTYNFELHAKNGYKWWLNRIDNALNVCDLLRLDHFRAFDRYYAVPYGDENAKNGVWRNGGGKQLFELIKNQFGTDKLIAEDLGCLDEGVYELLKFSGLAGMKVISFAFDGSPDNPYLLKNIPENSICYTGTHDNDTLMGLLESLDKNAYETHLQMVKNQLDLIGVNMPLQTGANVVTAMIELAYASNSKLVITPLQDLLYLDGNYRVNTPSTVSIKNWSVRIDSELLDDYLTQRLVMLNAKYKRNKRH